MDSGFQNDSYDPSFCGELGFGPFQKGGLLTPCFNDMVLLTGAHTVIILGSIYRIVTVMQLPAYRNPKYFLNFWGFLFTSAIFLCSAVLLAEGIYFIEKNRKDMVYIILFRGIQMVAWTLFFIVQMAQISRFLPHSRLVLSFSRIVFVPSTIKIYGIARGLYGNIQPEQKITFYPMYALICFLTLESTFYFYLSFGRKIINPENLTYDEIPSLDSDLDLDGPRRYFENWSGGLTMAPKRLFAPKNVKEVVQIVKLAVKWNQKVRVVGNARTNNQSLLTDGFLVSLQNMTNLNREIVPVSNEDDKYLVTVEAGINMKDLFEELLQLSTPLCLPVTDDLWDFALGGAIICGRHGSGRAYPTISEYVVGMEVVTGTGEVIQLDESNPELLNSARVSLGYLGIVTSLTLKLEPSYVLEQEKRGANVDDIIADLPRILVEVDHFEFYWFPHTNKCQTVRRHSVKDVGLRKNMGIFRRFFNWYGENFVLGALNRIMESFPILTPYILKIETLFLDQGNVHGPTSLIQSNVDPLEPYFEVEFAIPFKNGLKAFADLRSLVDDAKNWEVPYYCNQNISVRFSKADSAYLSPVYSEDTTLIRNPGEEWTPDFIWIAFYGYDQYIINTTDFFLAVQDLFVTKHGGRPSWPGEVYMTTLERARCFPKFPEFARRCLELDPQGIFRNSFLSDAIECIGKKTE